jgi:DNA invertase Pin-like site-specific DNA recombinase
VLKIASYYIENERERRSSDPSCFDFSRTAHQGDVLLIEQVDRLSRLGTGDWGRLRTKLQSR